MKLLYCKTCGFKGRSQTGVTTSNSRKHSCRRGIPVWAPMGTQRTPLVLTMMRRTASPSSAASLSSTATLATPAASPSSTASVVTPSGLSSAATPAASPSSTTSLVTPSGLSSAATPAASLSSTTSLVTPSGLSSAATPAASPLSTTSLVTPSGLSSAASPSSTTSLVTPSGLSSVATPTTIQAAQSACSRSKKCVVLVIQPRPSLTSSSAAPTSASNLPSRKTLIRKVMSGKRKRDQNTDPMQPLRLTERALALADDITDPSVRGSMLTLLSELKISLQETERQQAKKSALEYISRQCDQISTAVRENSDKLSVLGGQLGGQSNAAPTVVPPRTATIRAAVAPLSTPQAVHVPAPVQSVIGNVAPTRATAARHQPNAPVHQLVTPTMIRTRAGAPPVLPATTATDVITLLSNCETLADICSLPYPGYFEEDSNKPGFVRCAACAPKNKRLQGWKVPPTWKIQCQGVKKSVAWNKMVQSLRDHITRQEHTEYR